MSQSLLTVVKPTSAGKTAMAEVSESLSMHAQLGSSKMEHSATRSVKQATPALVLSAGLLALLA